MLRKNLKTLLYSLSLAVLLVCWLGHKPAWCQELSITAEVSPRQAAVGQNIRLVITIEGKVNLSGSPSLPDMPDFQVFGGGRSSNFSFINGQISSSLMFTYILIPKRAGNFTIGPVSIMHGGKTYFTQPIALTIVNQSSSNPSVPSQPFYSPGTGSQAPPATRQEPNAPATSDPVFITTQVDHKSVYINQPILLTFRFYSSIPWLSQPQYQPPATNGFWSEDLPPQQEYITNLGNREYRVIEIHTALFPTTTGKLTIGPANLLVQIQDFQRRFHDPFIDNFFSNFFSQGKQVSLHSQPIDINVLPLPPTGRPADFSGTVGQWSLSAKLDRKQAKVGEAVTLEVRIFGQGNVKSIGKPALPTLTGFKVYETVSSSEVQKENRRVQGVKIYRTLLRPEVTGTLTIPSIHYNYFNPQTKTYEQVSVPDLTLEVLPGGAPATESGLLTNAPMVTGPGVKVVAQDIRYLKIQVYLKPAAQPLPPLIWLLGFLFPPAVLAGLWLWRQQQDKLIADPTYARRLTADRSARHVLRQAQSARIRKDSKAFYAALTRALMGYLADRLGVSRSGVTQREILETLRSLGAETKIVEELSELLDECDFARFAPSERNSDAMASHARQAEVLLSKLVQFLEKEKKV